MEEKSGKKPLDTCSRGVTAVLDSSPQESPANDYASIRQVRSQLQNVIELMGPTTPHFYGSSHEEDNDESFMSSYISSTLEVKVAKSSPNADSTPRDFSISNLSNPEPAYRDVGVKTNTPDFACDHFRYFNECPHAAALRYLQHVPMHQCVSSKSTIKQNTLKKMLNKIRNPCNNKSSYPTIKEFYKMNVSVPDADNPKPTRLVFDLVEGIPKPELHTVATNTNLNGNKSANVDKAHSGNRSIHDQNFGSKGMIVTHNVADNKGLTQKKTFFANSDIGKVEVYYFDHGNAAYYRTTESTPMMATELLAEKTENYTTKFWAEFFGTIYIGCAFVTTFLLQLLRFILYSIIRPLTVGAIQYFADYFFKPCLAVLFNAIIQPPLILVYNVATSLRDLCEPIADGCSHLLHAVSIPLRACRLFTIKHDHAAAFSKVVKDASCECDEKDMESCMKS